MARLSSRMAFCEIPNGPKNRQIIVTQNATTKYYGGKVTKITFSEASEATHYYQEHSLQHLQCIRVK